MENKYYEEAIGLYNDDDIAGAIEKFKLALDLGCIEAAYELGIIYLDNIDEYKDINKVIYYFKLGCENNHLDCYKELSKIYYSRKQYKQYLDLIDVDYYNSLQEKSDLEYYNINEIEKVIDSYIKQQELYGYTQIIKCIEKFSKMNSKRISVYMLRIAPSLYKKYYYYLISTSHNILELEKTRTWIMQDIKKNRYVGNLDDINAKYLRKAIILFDDILNSKSYDGIVEYREELQNSCSSNLVELFDRKFTALRDEILLKYKKAITEASNVDELNKIYEDFVNNKFVEDKRLLIGSVETKKMQLLIENFKSVLDYQKIVNSILKMTNGINMEYSLLKLEYHMFKSFLTKTNDAEFNVIEAKKHYDFIKGKEDSVYLYKCNETIYEVADKYYEKYDVEIIEHILETFNHDVIDYFYKKNDKRYLNDKTAMLAKQLFDKLATKYGFHGFMHETHINNLVNILRNSFISCRSMAEKFIDIANGEVIEKTKNTDKEVLDYVRFYFYQKTPTNYNFDLSYPNELCYLVFDESVALIENAKITNGNASKNATEKQNFKNYLLKRRIIMDWDTIFSRGAYNAELLDAEAIKRKRSAELLVPRMVDVKYIKKIVFKTIKDKNKFKNLLNDDILYSEIENKICIDTDYKYFNFY